MLHKPFSQYRRVFLKSIIEAVVIAVPVVLAVVGTVEFVSKVPTGPERLDCGHFPAAPCAMEHR
jgi:hypothetical protein